MSKAFTKEDDGSGEVRLDDLPQSPHPNLVTPSGLAALNKRLGARRSDLLKLRGAAEDIATKLAVATAERDIRFLEARVSRAILVDSKGQSPNIVAFGATVEVLAHDDARRTFRIVGEDEADPARGMITRFSPLGVALIGAKLGSTVEWKKPRNTVDLEIVAIRYEDGSFDEENLRRMVYRFYERVGDDALLGPVFEQAIGAADDLWEPHLQTMTDFWHTVMLHKVAYKGRARNMGRHLTRNLFGNTLGLPVHTTK